MLLHEEYSSRILGATGSHFGGATLQERYPLLAVTVLPSSGKISEKAVHKVATRHSMGCAGQKKIQTEMK